MNDNDIKGAFERMGPAPEAEDRMLATILAETDALARMQAPAKAQGARTHASGALQGEPPLGNHAHPENPERPCTAVRTASPNRWAASHRGTPGKHRAWKRVLPLAACLILLVGIGAFAGSLYFGSLDNKLGASMQSASIDASSEKGAAEESAASPSDGYAAVPAPAATLPRIELGGGALITIAFAGETETGEADPLLAESTLVGEEIGPATAYNEDGTETVSCTVYAYSDEQTPYAVRYGDSAVLYRAMLDTAQGEGEPAK